MISLAVVATRLCFLLCATVQLENHTGAVSEDALYGGAVERHQQSLDEDVLPEDTQEIELCLFYPSCCQVLLSIDLEEADV